MPELYIITGSNGAGKSSIGPDYLPTHIKMAGPVFDGDKLFVDKRNELWQTIKAPKEVRKLAFEFVVGRFEEEVEAALAANANYAYEGHFTNDNTWDIPRRFKKAVYFVNLIFLGLNNPETSQMRVVERVRDGGHWVDRQTIEDNFYGNMQKLEQHIDAVDRIQIIDTTSEHTLLVEVIDARVIACVPLNHLPAWFVSFFPKFTKMVAAG